MEHVPLIVVAGAYGLGLATGLWLGFRLWRLNYVELVDGHYIRRDRS